MASTSHTTVNDQHETENDSSSNNNDNNAQSVLQSWTRASDSVSKLKRALAELETEVTILTTTKKLHSVSLCNTAERPPPPSMRTMDSKTYRSPAQMMLETTTITESTAVVPIATTTQDHKRQKPQDGVVQRAKEYFFL